MSFTRAIPIVILLMGVLSNTDAADQQAGPVFEIIQTKGTSALPKSGEGILKLLQDDRHRLLNPFENRCNGHPILYSVTSITAQAVMMDPDQVARVFTDFGATSLPVTNTPKVLEHCLV